VRVAIASGKGGTGKTLVTTNLFRVAQQQGIPVSIVDCDAEEPNVAEFLSAACIDCYAVTQNIPVIDASVCTFCNQCAEYCNYNAIVCLPESRFIVVLDELCHDCGACSVACNHGAISERKKTLGKVRTYHPGPTEAFLESRTEVGVYSPVPVIRSALKTAGNHHLNLLDAPPGISCPFIATVDHADYVVLVTEPTPFGVNDLQLSVDTLRELGKPFGVVVNRAGLGNRLVYDYLNKNGISLLAEIPFDREIARVYSEGKLVVDDLPRYAPIFEGLLRTIQNPKNS